MAGQGITAYRLAHSAGVPESKISTFLNHGKGLGANKVGLLVTALNIQIKDKAGNTHPDFRSALAAALAGCEMTKADLCHFWGVNVSALCNYLKGAPSISVGVLDKLFRKLEVTLVTPE